MSYAGGSGNVRVNTITAPHDGFRGRMAPNPTGHKALTQSPLPYRQEDPHEPNTRYCDVEANGIVPGYAGHRPRAQHTYGRAAFGDPNGVSHAANLRRKSEGKLERGGEDAFASGFLNGEGIDGAMKGHPDTKTEKGIWSENQADYKVQVGGVLPGYGGHVPRAIHKFGASAVGATPQFADSDEHKEVEELRKMFSRAPEVKGLPEGGDYPRADPNDDGEEWWPRSPPKAAIEGYMTDYRHEINGVIPKYAGHVPRAKDKYGGSAFGKTRTVAGQSLDKSNSGVKTEGVMGQVNRENTKAEVPFAPSQRLDGNGVIPGYRGHVPNVVNAIGMSTYLSGPGFTEIKAESMEKMGGAGDLGDSAAAYGMNDWGASSFSDGAADMDNLGGMNITASMAKDSASAGGFVDTWTPGDEAAAKAEAAKAEAAAMAKQRAADIARVKAMVG